jgi:hypothetical protein
MKDELIQKIATIFNIPYTEELDGSIVTEVEDATWLYNGYKKILKEQIENKDKLIQLTEKRYYNTEYDQLKNTEELLRLKRELFDLEVEYIAKDDYIKTYQGHMERSRIAYNQDIAVAKEKLPELIEKANKYLSERPDQIYSHKINMQLYGLLIRCESLQSDIDYVDCYRSLNILFSYIENAGKHKDTTKQDT